ncbi:flagellar biosynthesis regulator FlaF [Amphiplicatus metriothermophilus]|uniref:Flagellar protein FlaF n=1 Tax=Amphiplicatus metriothermophilus TaxID=1519374 RepID=A0A239PKK0_9PROT|nr:flagellar biosynthesis regulator FlaF [Amphiplicatus metriothermophilus]MBB5517326.1 flagellar protein FlaF [Amphiplicatus metriothermophilus]SNT68338.1 flagellar protein FlaF [Amphiplicatus metriothermophilus]
MNEYALAQNAYVQATRSIGAPREVEYKVFARITRALSETADIKPADGADFPRLVGALHENLALWTALASDVSREGNGLPAELRSKIFYLFEFTREHTRKVMRGDADAQILIDINTSIMRGLKGQTNVAEIA